MKLHTLVKSSGRTKKQQRVGRGNAAKRGNYSGKGHKGQKARSGFSQHAAFEGGQTPLFMRLPKRKWFKRYFKLVDDVAVVNLDRLEQDEKVESGATVSKATLKDRNYIKKEDIIVKILWTGELTKKLTFDGLERYSKSAIEKIEKAGGTINK